MADLTHIGDDGRAQMVDVSDKTETERSAIARGFVRMSKAAFAAATDRDTAKGDPIAIAELAGIMGAKKTSDLIPLCHPLPLSNVKVEISADPETQQMNVTARAKTSGKTGVEMEALTAVSVACLTLYDMLKAIDKSMQIHGIELIEKTGGKSGHYQKARA
ncbi:MAG: cyclic pyranopterin monophosphate synthase MoaC [Pseudomonadota bacterium]